jgi:hypothetical protein
MIKEYPIQTIVVIISEFDNKEYHVNKSGNVTISPLF